ncbi:MAG: hypothetical protein JO010_07060, partial [Alphaproteobacteria bacterium]|nr:hypothetical protein [Alphaproteobacteria bacterium]
MGERPGASSDRLDAAAARAGGAWDRRRFLGTALGGAASIAATRLGVAAPGSPQRHLVAIDSAVPEAGSAGMPSPAEAFGMVGVFDIDWLLDDRFGRLLDNMAASPGAFKRVRVFGALNSGARENVAPMGSGRVWPRGDAPPDFSVTLAALEALTARALCPFIALSFFPAAVSPSPIEPPRAFDRWQELLAAFFDRLVDRFGAAAVASWWFEVWNEPNMPPFWRGSFAQYLDLYRATSEAVRASGHRIRLGGPAIAYIPPEGAALIERFLGFLAAEPRVRCDFVSLHRKGIWTGEEAEPLIERLAAAAEDTARAVLRIVPDRARFLAIVNDEADM